MPSKFEMLDESLVMTEAERLAHRRFEAYFVFETMADAEFQRRLKEVSHADIPHQVHGPEERLS